MSAPAPYRAAVKIETHRVPFGPGLNHLADRLEENKRRLAETWPTEDCGVLCDRCGTDEWRVFSGDWSGWAECSWCGHRQKQP